MGYGGREVRIGHGGGWEVGTGLSRVL